MCVCVCVPWPGFGFRQGKERHGLQYLVKMASDTGFLSQVQLFCCAPYKCMCHNETFCLFTHLYGMSTHPQNAAIAAWLHFDPVRNPFLLPPRARSSPSLLVDEFETLRLGSTQTNLYCPIIPADITLERMVLAAKVVAEAEVEVGVAVPEEDAGFSVAVPLQAPVTSGWATTQHTTAGKGNQAEPSSTRRSRRGRSRRGDRGGRTDQQPWSNTGLNSGTGVRHTSTDDATLVGMVSRQRSLFAAQRSAKGSRRKRKAVALQRRRDLREARERRNR